MPFIKRYCSSIFFLFFILALFSALPASAQSDGFKAITPEQAKEILETNKEAIALDVRPREEFLNGHLVGAVNIPYTELEARAPAELPDKNATIVIYCKRGRSSLIAAITLAKLGYTNLYEFKGIENWPYETTKE